MIVGNYEKFCKKYYECEGYEKAIKSRRKYFLHHIQGENVSRDELIENNLYYDCVPEKLRWVTYSEHNKIHRKGVTHSDESKKKMSDSKKGEKSPFFGKSHSLETIKKMSAAHKGKAHSEETRRKISDGKKGKASYRKGMSWKLIDGKRIWYKKYVQLALELG